MKFSQKQIETVTKVLGFQVIADDHDILPKLEEVFGSHTFFLNDSGLFVFRPQGENSEDPNTARLLAVATWSDEKKGQLSPLKPPSEIDVLFDLVECEVINDV